MTTGLTTTIETLTASRNSATNAVLLDALAQTDLTVFDETIKAIVARRSKAGHLAVLRRWHQLTEPQQQLLQEGRGRMSGALRDAVLSDDDQLFANACQLVEQFGEFDLVSTLVTLAENQKSKHAEAATELVLRLVQQLSDLIYAPSDNNRRDPSAMSRFVLESLERSVERFRTHNRNELIEAFVILSGPTSSVLRQILDEPHHPCYITVINTLTNSKSAGVIDYLLGSLKGEFTSLNILNVISKRSDPEFVSHLLQFTDQKLSAKVTKNLARIRSFVWLKPGSEGYANFNEQDQARCVKLVGASGVKTDEFLDMLENILKRGEPQARWTACDALAAIPGDRGNHLVLDAIYDHDPQVQAAATRQIRNRHIADSMAILLKQLDSPHEVVREATREALTEFSFSNFLAGFESLHDDARRTTGRLVKKVDTETAAGLLVEMEAKSHKRRLRALEMADVMELVPEVSEGVLQLLEDNDHLIRAAAADVLQFCPTAEVQTALRHAANDRSSAVQNAAKGSLEVFDSLNITAKATAASEGQS